MQPESGFDFLSAPARHVPGHARWLGNAWAFKKALAAETGCEVVHFMDAREGLGYPRGRTRTVGTIHDYYFIRPSEYWRHRHRYPDWPIRLPYAMVARALERAAYRRLDGLIANSEATRARVSAAYRIPAGRFTTIYIGLEPPTGPGGIGVERCNAVLFVGGNPYRKGLDRLIRCLPNLGVPDVELWVAGARVPERLRNEAVRRGLADRIRELGRVDGDALRALYDRAKVVALPGVTEAFGLVFMEAMAAGCAVVGPVDGGAAELIEDGVNGYLVPHENDLLLQGRLRALLTDDQLRGRMAEAAARTLSGRTLGRMAVETGEAYEAVLGNRDRPGRHGSDAT
jgi:glycosyltransferase involved in cell wall biosynthesis